MAPASRIWAKLRATPPFVKYLTRHTFICLSWIPVAIFVNDNIFEITKIQGPSMSPLFNERHNETTSPDICLTKKRYLQGPVERGMIVTFFNPMKPDDLNTKRVVALPGDIVPFKGSFIRVPPHHVWMEGDGGKELSLDSNNYGPVSIRLIQGHITHILWPYRKAGKIKWWEHPDRLAAFRE